MNNQVEELKEPIDFQINKIDNNFAAYFDSVVAVEDKELEELNPAEDKEAIDDVVAQLKKMMNSATFMESGKIVV